jgi:hypothetical protein
MSPHGGAVPLNTLGTSRKLASGVSSIPAARHGIGPDTGDPPRGAPRDPAGHPAIPDMDPSGGPRATTWGGKLTREADRDERGPQIPRGRDVRGCRSFVALRVSSVLRSP